MKKVLLLASLLGFIAMPSCKKTSTDPTTPTISSVNDIKVPSGFSWESSRNVQVTVNITDVRFGTALHGVSIYTGDPYNGGSLIARGGATTSSAYVSKLYLNNQITELYVVKTSPDKSQIIQKIAVTGTTASLSFSDKDESVMAGKSSATGRMTGDDVSPDCSTGCTRTITATTSSLNVNTGDVICITGSGITVGFSGVNGGVIRVCGSNVRLENLNLNGSAKLIVATAGSANVSGMNYNSAAASVINFGTLNGTFADGGIFTNYGTFNCPGDFNINGSAGAFLNGGTMNVSGSFNNGGRVSAENKGRMVISGHFQQNGGSAAFVNSCSLIISGNYNQSAVVRNHNLINVAGTSTINSATELGLYNGAMLNTARFILDGSIVKGYGSTSLIRITGSTDIRNSGAVITDAVQVCNTSSIDGSRLSRGAVRECSVYIPTSDCNGIGNGTIVITDTDGDSVPDASDDYPEDPAKAYNNYYPSAERNATVAFEDQWPLKGDYDLNDVVVAYRYNIVTNSKNNVVQVNGTYTLRATGGSLGNGFGVQFPVSKDYVMATSSPLEDEQRNAVVIVFTNMRDEMPYWNTTIGERSSDPREYRISFDVKDGMHIKEFGLGAYNPFIWNYGLGYGREREVHLPGQLPTDLNRRSLIATEDDYSVESEGRWYLTRTGLPYAITVPNDPFEYPVEGIDITKAYRHFGAWAESAGTRYADWYSNTASDYRTRDYIYAR